MRGAAAAAAALRALPSSASQPLARTSGWVVVVSPRLSRQPLGGRAPCTAVWSGSLRHLHSGRVLRTSDGTENGNGASGSAPVAHGESDVRTDDEDASPASNLPEQLGPEESADFIREVERQTARTAAPQQPVTAAEARTLFDNLSKQLDEPVDYEAVRERNLRRLSREQRLIDSDVDAVARWVDAHEEEIEKFADDEEQLLSTMRDPDGSEGLGLELGEEDLLFPGHRMAEAGTQASKTVAPPVDRLDPTVPHSEEFDYTFQEMMQAAADEEEDRSAALRQRQADIEKMNKARGQRMGDARVREVDEEGRSFATGHKKSAIARVCLTPGEGLMYVNGRPIDLYFPYYRRYQLLQPFELTGTLLNFNMTAKVHGGGLAGQLDALKYGIARALQKQDPAAYRDVLKAAKLLTRDARKVERKKSGQLKARKKFTWVKR